MSNKLSLILLCGGLGKRFSEKIPKQFFKIDNLTLLEINLKKFLELKLFSKIVVVSEKSLIKKTNVICKNYKYDGVDVISGGETRQISSKLGCLYLKKYHPKFVFIHDVARPFIEKEMILRLLSKVTNNVGSIPVVSISDTLNLIKKEKILKKIERENIYKIQTPQAFPFNKILFAHENCSKDCYTDDGSLAKDFNIEIKPVLGSKTNIKITTEEDIKLAKIIHQIETKKMREFVNVGSGFDVHEFTDGNQIILCGVKIPFKKKLKGHSDADVGIHAIVDSILGALACGDIGDFFPPTDARWKNISSKIFLEKAKELLKKKNAYINNIDLTLICEEPKISKYKNKMEKKIASILEIDPININVKATTTEKLGFLGRKEGIAAQAISSIKIFK